MAALEEEAAARGPVAAPEAVVAVCGPAEARGLVEGRARAGAARGPAEVVAGDPVERLEFREAAGHDLVEERQFKAASRGRAASRDRAAGRCQVEQRACRAAHRA